MTTKKVVDVSALILEAMSDEDSLMPYQHPNGISIDTRNQVEGSKTSVEGYWTAPDTGDRYYILADVEVTVKVFDYSPDDEDW